MILAKKHVLFVSREILVEMARVLRYPRLRALFGLTDEQIYNYVQFLKDVGTVVESDDTLNVPIRDPKDAMVLQAAVSGEADVICTLDRDFYTAETRGFCATFGIDICDDVELAKRLQRGDLS
jgi:putative PIN family toxin of toxin-antitoxin system